MKKFIHRKVIKNKTNSQEITNVSSRAECVMMVVGPHLFHLTGKFPTVLIHLDQDTIVFFPTSCFDKVNVWWQNMPPPNMSLWHKDYFELRANEKKQI